MNCFYKIFPYLFLRTTNKTTAIIIKGTVTPTAMPMLDPEKQLSCVGYI